MFTWDMSCGLVNFSVSLQFKKEGRIPFVELIIREGNVFFLLVKCLKRMLKRTAEEIHV